ncbi:carbohydrate-binding family 9-like protein [Flammeovirga pacifica]|nr:carbohydrate-binding family 9-like protein [Flammeovirga pacifica]
MTIQKVNIFIILMLLKFGAIAQVLPTPESYLCYQANQPIEIDGALDEADWAKAEWTELFLDIEGDQMTKPKFDTKVKMLWDDQYLYIAAEMIEPHLWSTITERDAVIYLDNDFEVFINPLQDSPIYYEFEVNLLNTVWDMMMPKPYRDGGRNMNSWHIEGLKSATKMFGTINDPSDIDEKWTVEIAFPLSVLSQERPDLIYPVEGRRWRINFSRVEWQHEIVEGKYTKKINPETKKAYPEYNWVWSPQGAINMHMPEQWGYLEFTKNKVGDKKNTDVSESESERLYRQLFDVYRAQRAFKHKNKKYAKSMKELKFTDKFMYNNKEVKPYIQNIPHGYYVVLEIPQEDLTLMVRHDSNGEIIKK